MKHYWNRVCAMLLVFALCLTLLPGVAFAAEEGVVHVSTQAELADALSNQSVSQIVVDNDIEMSGNWSPALISEGRSLTIEGGGHTISNMTVRECLLHAADPGQTGNDCDYYAGFIGNVVRATLVINDLRFADADVRIDPLSPKKEEVEGSKGSKGSSIVAVVCANNQMGSVTLNRVSVVDSQVAASTKVGLLHGFSQTPENSDGHASFTANQCAITGSKVTLVADGWDTEAAFAGVIIGYAPSNSSSVVKTNGILLSDNTCVVDPSVDWGADSVMHTDDDGTQYVTAYDSDWGLVSPTYANSPYGMDTVQFAAEYNGYQYETVSDAVSAAEAGSTVKLVNDVTENVAVASGKALTLDLNGKTLSGQVTCSGNLTVEDSTVTAEPVISSDYETVTYASGKITNGGTTVLAKDGGSVTLKSGTLESTGNIAAFVMGDYTGATEIKSTFNIDGGYLLSREFSASAQGRGATLNIRGGVLTAEDNAVVAGNGTHTAEKKLGGTEINISGGSLIGHIVSDGYIACGVYHPQEGALNITGGTIYAEGGVGVLMRGGTMRMSDGGIIATGTASGKVGDSSVIANCYGVQLDRKCGYYASANSTVSITGGKISADQGSSVLDLLKTEEDADGTGKIAVSGGSYTSNPDTYLAEGYTVVQDGKLFKVEKKGQTPAEVVVGEADVDTDGLKDADGNKVDDPDVIAAVEEAIKGTKAANLEVAANETASRNELTPTTPITVAGAETTPAEALKSATGKPDIAPEAVKIVVQPYLDIQAKSYDGTKKTLTLEITPMYRTVATTADVIEGKEGIVLPAPDVSASVNAVEIGIPQKLNVTAPVEIAVPVPEGFLADVDVDAVYVKHTKDNGRVYYYKAKVQDNADNDTIIFVNPNGFSTFEAKIDTRSTTIEFDSEIGTKTYTPANVGDAFPVPATIPSCKRFTGWQIDGRIYTSLTDDLLTKIDTKTVQATAQFRNKPSGSSVTTTEDEDHKCTAFTDISTHWAKDSICFAVEKGWMNGVSDTAFAPDAATSRAMIATILWRLAGEPAPTTICSFTDVADGMWYTDAINWAAEQKLVNGYSETTFGVDDNITRQQMAAMLYRYAGRPDSAGMVMQEYSDGMMVADWAKDAMRWAIHEGLITGKTDGRLDPAGNATRAEVTAILARFAEQ